jgi:hypothetical protein
VQDDGQLTGPRTALSVDKHADSMVLIDLIVNPLFSMVFYIPFATLNQYDLLPNLCEVALRVRVLHKTDILIDLPLYWHQLAVLGHYRTFEVLESSRVASTGSKYAKDVHKRQDAVLSRPDFFDGPRLLCEVKGMPATNVPGCVSLEQAFTYLGEPVATEAWFEWRLAESLHLLFGTQELPTISADFDTLLSLMVLPDAHGRSITNRCSLVADMLHHPRNQDDQICIAFHLLMTLAFHKWTEGSTIEKLQRVFIRRGFPYVVMNTHKVVIWLIPLGKLAITLGLENVPPLLSINGELIQANPQDEIAGLSTFAQYVKEVPPFGFRRPLDPNRVSLDSTLPRHVYGNAHEVLLGRASGCSFVEAHPTLKLQPNKALEDERWLLSQFAGRVVPLVPIKSEPHVYQTAFPPLLRLVPAAIWFIEDSSVLQQLQKVAGPLDIAPFNGGWVVRRGEVPVKWF